jgi:hypothetical protein
MGIAAAACTAAAQFVTSNLYLSGQLMGLMLNIMIKNGRDFMDAILL